MLKSFHVNASDEVQYEAYVKFDYDDEEALTRFPEIQGIGGKVYTIFAERRWTEEMSGYVSIGAYYNQMMRMAHVDWLWMMNDDCWIEGKDWDKAIEEFTEDDVDFLQPLDVTWGKSIYTGYDRGPFPIVRKSAFDWMNEEMPLADPIDLNIYHRFKEKEIGPKYVEGFVLHHERDSEAELERHRL